jgi:Ca-activated chloride channel homolog
MKKIKTFSIAITMLFFNALVSQEILITGTVIDESGFLPFASISIKNSKKVVNSDFDGKFSIHASSKDTLVCTYVGLQTQSIAIGVKNNFTIKMIDNSQLETVYPRQITCNRERIIDCQIVTAEDLKKDVKIEEKRVIDTVVQAKPKITYRCGLSNFSRDSKPLYVVDVHPTSAEIMKDIDPIFIESMSVLKGLSATALYGSSAVNGAIIIKTKNLSKLQIKKLKKRSQLYLESQNEKIKIRN